MKKILNQLKDFALITIGSLIAAVAVSVFLAPHAVVSGGVSGIAIVINKFTGFPIGVAVLLMNIPLFFAGAIFLGKSFGIKSLYGAFVFSIFMDAVSTDVILTENVLMSALFGGVLLGIGFGLIFLTGATTGGTDILASIGNKFVPAIDLGKWFFIFDIIIILSGVVFLKNTELLLAGIVALFLNSWVLDYVISGFNVSKMVYIISDKSDEIAAEIMKNLERGVTGIKSVGMYTKGERTMLMCIVKKFELQKLEKITESKDPDAFIILTQAHQVKGEGFVSYPIQQKNINNKNKKRKKKRGL